MNKHDPFDTQDLERSKAQAQQRSQHDRDTEAGDVKWLMSSKRGRRVIWRHLDRAGVFRLSFNTNAMQMAFAEGNRNEGLRLLTQVHTLCPELYPVMVREANDQRNPDGERPNDH